MANYFHSNPPLPVINAVAITVADTTYNVPASIGFVRVDASGGSININLPSAGAILGQTLEIFRTDNTLASAVIIFAAGGQSILSDATGTPTSIDTANECVRLVAVTSTLWVIAQRTFSSAWVTYTPTLTGFGTVSNLSARWRRDGECIQVSASWVSGTVTGAIASISLPAGLSIDPQYISQTNTIANPGPIYGRYASQYVSLTGDMVVAITTSATVVYFGQPGPSTDHLVAAPGTSVAVNATATSVNFTVPIGGWKG